MIAAMPINHTRNLIRCTQSALDASFTEIIREDKRSPAKILILETLETLIHDWKRDLPARVQPPVPTLEQGPAEVSRELEMFDSVCNAVRPLAVAAVNGTIHGEDKSFVAGFSSIWEALEHYSGRKPLAQPNAFASGMMDQLQALTESSFGLDGMFGDLKGQQPPFWQEKQLVQFLGDAYVDFVVAMDYLALSLATGVEQVGGQ